MDTKMHVSRRSFIKGGLVAGGVAAIGALSGFSGSSSASASAAASGSSKASNAAVGVPDTWDAEADVVIVGYGGAGAIAAITAADDGASVILLEKYPADTDTEIKHTPSSRFCGGICVCAQDAKEGSDALYALSFGSTPKDVCDAWGEGAARNVEYWNSLGAEYPEPSWDTGEYPDLPGGHTIGVSRVDGGGPRMFQVLMQNVQKRADSITVMYETPGERLIQNAETKEIVGVVAKQGDKEINVKAKKAVALCTGGFEWDEEMKQNFLRGYPSYFYTNPNNTGEGIRMGQAVGGALWHMNAISARAIPYCPDWPKGTSIQLKLPYIFVNKYGERWFYENKWPSHNAWVEFVNFSSRTAEYKASPAWIIYDSTSEKPLLAPQSKGFLGDSDTLQNWGPDGLDDEETAVSKGWLLRADTPEALADLILADEEDNGRMTEEALAATIEKFNGFCAAGEDTDFERDVDSLVPLQTPPYYAVKVYPGGPNTQGGLKKNASGQVMDPFDEPIKRLYCAGENGSVYGFLYPTGGGNVCEMTVFGQVIGHAMAAETAWE